MGVYVRPDSIFFWILLEGTGRKKESTGIRRDAIAPAVRKANRLAAEAVYHARMTQLAKQRVGLPIDSNATFATFSAWYETHHLEKHRGAAREKVILARLRQHFGSYRLPDIKPAAWTEYETTRLKDGVSQNTIGRELAVMKQILTSAVGEHLDVSPLAHVKRKTVRLPAKRTITAQEEKRLLLQLSDAGADARNRGEPDRTPDARRRELLARAELHDLYLVGVGTLLRQMSLIQLRRRDVHADRVALMTKTGPHQVSLAGPSQLQRRAAMILRRRLPKTADGFFFPEWQARFANDRDGANAKFLQAFRRACKRAGIPWGLKQHGVVWHTATRASGATRMLRDYGIDVRTVQLTGGWRSLDQMAEYLGIDLSVSTVKAKRRSA